MSTLRVSTIQDTAGSNSSTPSQIASGRAKAWVNFNGTGVVAIRAQYNVSSITDNGTGDYTVNFTTAMVDANYSGVVTPAGDSVAITLAYEANRSTNTTTAAYRIQVTSTSAAADRASVSVAIFR